MPPKQRFSSQDIVEAAAAMFLTVLSFNLLGDRLRELNDIRNRHTGG